jgi:hypothetical protein
MDRAQATGVLVLLTVVAVVLRVLLAHRYPAEQAVVV